MRTFVLALIDTKGSVCGEAGGGEEVLRLERVGEVVDHCLARQPRIVEHDGQDQNENAEVGEDDDGKHAKSGMTEG